MQTAFEGAAVAGAIPLVTRTKTIGYQRLDRLPYELRPRVAKQPFGLCVDGDEQTSTADEQDPVGHRIDELRLCLVKNSHKPPGQETQFDG